MQFIVGQVTGYEEKDGRLTGAKVTGSDGVTRVVPLDMLLVFFGLSPKLGPIAEWGLDIERKQVKVDTEKFATNTPGIFAVGDINTYPGKKKLILSGFHECALAAFGAAPFIFPDKKIHLQYTTTSPEAAQGAGRGDAGLRLRACLPLTSCSVYNSPCSKAHSLGVLPSKAATEKVPLNLTEVILAQGSKLSSGSGFSPGATPPKQADLPHTLKERRGTSHVPPAAGATLPARRCNRRRLCLSASRRRTCAGRRRSNPSPSLERAQRPRRTSQASATSR